MVKQNQNRVPHQVDQERKRSYATPKGSGKEKAMENLQNPTGEGSMQGAKSQYNKKASSQQKLGKLNRFDRNEGEGHSQKF